jgi:hypothetical protein
MLVPFYTLLHPNFLQVFVETLDKTFENVCELDLIFHVDKVGCMNILETYYIQLFIAVYHSMIVQCKK